MAAAVALALLLGLVIGSFLERGRLPAAARRVARSAAVAVPELRHAGAALRQRPGPLVAGPARALPELRPPDLGALPARRAGDRPALRRRGAGQGDDAIDIALGLLLVTALVPIVLIDLEHRLIPNRITLPAAIAGRRRDRAARPRLPARGADRRRGRRRVLLPGRGPLPAGMGMGDVKLAGLLGPVPRPRRRAGALRGAHPRRARRAP